MTKSLQENGRLNFSETTALVERLSDVLVRGVGDDESRVSRWTTTGTIRIYSVDTVLYKFKDLYFKKSIFKKLEFPQPFLFSTKIQNNFLYFIFILLLCIFFYNSFNWNIVPNRISFFGFKSDAFHNKNRFFELAPPKKILDITYSKY